MFSLIAGHSKSGKSRFAELYTARYASGRMVYIATLIPVGSGEMGSALIARHRAQRAGMGFITMEQPLRLDTLPIYSDDSILLEDVSNLLANHLFCPQGAGMEQGAKATIEEINHLAGRCQNLVAVSINPFPPEEAGDAPTLHYIREIGRVNTRLCQMADQVIMLTNGKAKML